MTTKTQNLATVSKKPAKVYYIFKIYVHQTCSDKSAILLATSPCPSLVQLLRSISGECRTVASQQGSGPLSLISLLHRRNFLMKSSQCSWLTTPQLSGKKSKWEWNMCIINTSNAELNPICYLLALLGAHHILHVSRVRVKFVKLLKV